MACKVGSQFLQQLEQIENVSKLSQRVIRILGMNPSPMTLQGTNTYLVGTGEKRLLIDTGSPGVSEYQSNLGSVLEKAGVSIERILLTHWHSDHVGGVIDVFNTIKTKPTLHKFVSSKDTIENSFLPPGVSFQYFSDGDEFQVEGATLSMIHTPGHTDDHVAMLLKEENAIFCGDAILGQRSTTFEHLGHFMTSLDLIRSHKPALLYPGHGIVIENAVPFLSDYIQHRNSRDEQIVEVLKSSEKPLTLEDLLTAIYSDISDNLLSSAKKNLSLHLEKLEEENRVCRIHEQWRISFKDN